MRRRDGHFQSPRGREYRLQYQGEEWELDKALFIRFKRFSLHLGAAITLTAVLSSPLMAAQQTLSNGLTVDIYGAEQLRDRLTTIGGVPAIPLDGGRYLSVITDINDPSIYNKGDGAFHAFDRESVLSSLSDISHLQMSDLSVTVYILPFPRRNLLVSSTSGAEVFLSPHVLDIDPAISAYIVAHEVGHAFHNAFLPDGSRAWDTYRHIRGIANDLKYADNASHPYRPKEIFAEDFRVLFGGTEARFSGGIENPELASPIAVRGLEAFLARLGTEEMAVGRSVVAAAFPNPFNPETHLRLTVPQEVIDTGEDIAVRIYDVRGALVQDLYSGAAASQMNLLWDGTDRAGNRVASATYYALVRSGESRQTVKLVLLK